MNAPEWYDAWCEDAFATFTGKQKLLTETYRLSSWDRYDYDAAAGTLTFSDAGVEHGIEELTTEFLASDDLDGMGWMLAAIAARILDAEGAYRAPSGTGGLYLVLQSIKFVS